MAAWQDCPRLRWNRYHAEGGGLSTPGTKLPLAEGIWIHECLEGLLKGRSLEAVIADGREELQRALLAHPDAAALPHFLPEQTWMLEVLLRAWAQERLGVLLEEFELVASEQELLWPMGETPEGLPVIDMVRVDALMRKRSTGGLYYLEFKSTARGGDEWAKSWQRNSQLLANVLAIEEAWGERCEGVLIEGLVKGRRAVETTRSSRLCGQVVQQGPLAYGWKDKSGIIWPAYASGRTKVPLWEEDLLPHAWVEVLTREGVVSELFAPLPPIRPLHEHLSRWRETAVVQESRVARLVEAVTTGALPVHLAFPCHENHCFRYWGHPCEFEPLCFNAQVARDPLGSGLYQRRLPHHAAEAQEGSAACSRV